MPVFQPDFNEAIDTGAIQPGTYPAKVTAFELKTSKKGNPMLVGDAEIVVDGRPRSRKVYLVTTGPGSGSLKEYLRAIGRDDLTAPNASIDSDEIVNVDCVMVVENEDYEGQTRDKVSRFLKA